MPEIKIKHVVSFSSEDKVHKAENILKSETYRKWKCATPGEKNASIVLQFEKATQIHSIDIGNECSAFVEVLVGRSSDSVNEFQVLLVASSFMSPLESRNENHTNRVRMFDADKLAQNLKEEKWDCVQVVCTQPFNKNITYGLSFIKFHSPPEKYVEQPSESETKTSTTKLGAFQLKYDDDEEDPLPLSSVGSSWLQRKNNTNSLSNAIKQDAPSYAAAVLASTSLAPQSKSEMSHLSEYERMVQKNREEKLAFIKAMKISEAKDSFNEAVTSLKPKPLVGIKRSTLSPSTSREKKQHLDASKGNPLKRASDTNAELLGKPPAKKEFDRNSAQKASVSNKTARLHTKTPFHKIMDKVVFVISGFVNPLRGEIRDKALEMGAKYKGDWDKSCTHLVCAFVNTPKYIQVRSNGDRVVTKDWIMDCHRKKTLLPWRNYMLGKYLKDTSEEESESDVEETNVSKTRKGSPKLNGNHLKNQKKTTNLKRIIVSSDSDSAEEKSERSVKQSPKKNSLFGEGSSSGGTTSVQESSPTTVTRDDSETEDEEAIQDYVADTDVESDSGGDTEDEIRKVEERAKKKSAHSLPSVQSDSEEEEDSSSLLSSKPDTTDLPLPELPNLFKKRHFYLYGELSSKKRYDLQRYIIAYNGVLEDYMSDSVKYVVTEAEWDKNFEDALDENEDLIFVKPDWIFKCQEAEKLAPYQAYIVTPSL